jgi:hypothetical protein
MYSFIRSQCEVAIPKLNLHSFILLILNFTSKHVWNINTFIELVILKNMSLILPSRGQSMTDDEVAPIMAIQKSPPLKQDNNMRLRKLSVMQASVDKHRCHIS